MAFVSGKDAVAKVDNAAGTLTAITQYLTEFQLGRSPDQLDATALGDQDKSFLAGFIDAEVTISGSYDEADDAIHDILATAVGAAGTRTFEYGPEGGTSGKVRYTGELVILSYEVSVTVDNIVTFSCSGRVDGTVTRNTF